MKIFTGASVKDMADMPIDKVINEHLRANSDLVRSRAAIFIGMRINDDYDKYSNLLLSEMNEEIHFQNVRILSKSAWTIAIILIENLRDKDFFKIKLCFDKWDVDKQEDLVFHIKDFPSYISILKTGSI
jgi:hypothetical protein